jgi:hypothetical protein
MTHKPSRGEKSRQSGSVSKQKKARGALHAAVSILGASLGVTAAQSAGEIKPVDGASAGEFNTKVAAQNNQIKSNQFKSHQFKSNQFKSNQFKSNQFKSNNIKVRTPNVHVPTTHIK